MIYYTGHAKERMVLRGITENMVKITLLKPDKAGIGYHGRGLAFKKFGHGVIKVVYVKKNVSWIIVSVIWELIN